MGRVLCVLALTLLATAAVQATNKHDNDRYSNDQIDEINDRLAACLNTKHVPALGDFNRPGDTCRFEGITALSKGSLKEALTDVIVACLTKKKVTSTSVTSAKQCLTDSLAKKLVAA